MAAVGKKKKRVIVYRSKKSSSLVPLLIAGGVIAWAFLGKKNETPTPAPILDEPYDPSTDPTNLYDPRTGQLLQPDNSQVKVYTSPTPVSSIITTTDPVKQQYLNSLKSRIPASASIWPALNAMSQQGLMNLWSISGYINYATLPSYYDAFARMTDTELKNSYYYVGTYLGQGVPLLSATRKLPNGQFDNSNPGNPALYTAIQAIHLKYGIF